MRPDSHAPLADVTEIRRAQLNQRKARTSSTLPSARTEPNAARRRFFAWTNHAGSRNKFQITSPGQHTQLVLP